MYVGVKKSEMSSVQLGQCLPGRAVRACRQVARRQVEQEGQSAAVCPVYPPDEPLSIPVVSSVASEACNGLMYILIRRLVCLMSIVVTGEAGFPGTP